MNTCHKFGFKLTNSSDKTRINFLVMSHKKFCCRHWWLLTYALRDGGIELLQRMEVCSHPSTRNKGVRGEGSAQPDLLMAVNWRTTCLTLLHCSTSL